MNSAQSPSYVPGKGPALALATHPVLAKFITTYLGIYRTRSATTKPTVTMILLAGRNGTVIMSSPSSTDDCPSWRCCRGKLIFKFC